MANPQLSAILKFLQPLIISIWKRPFQWIIVFVGIVCFLADTLHIVSRRTLTVEQGRNEHWYDDSLVLPWLLYGSGLSSGIFVFGVGYVLVNVRKGKASTKTDPFTAGVTFGLMWALLLLLSSSMLGAVSSATLHRRLAIEAVASAPLQHAAPIVSVSPASGATPSPTVTHAPTGGGLDDEGALAPAPTSAVGGAAGAAGGGGGGGGGAVSTSALLQKRTVGISLGSGCVGAALTSVRGALSVVWLLVLALLAAANYAFYVMVYEKYAVEQQLSWPMGQPGGGNHTPSMFDSWSAMQHSLSNSVSSWLSRRHLSLLPSGLAGADDDLESGSGSGSALQREKDGGAGRGGGDGTHHACEREASRLRNLNELLVKAKEESYFSIQSLQAEIDAMKKAFSAHQLGDVFASLASPMHANATGQSAQSTPSSTPTAQRVLNFSSPLQASAAASAAAATATVTASSVVEVSGGLPTYTEWQDKLSELDIKDRALTQHVWHHAYTPHVPLIAPLACVGQVKQLKLVREQLGDVEQRLQDDQEQLARLTSDKTKAELALELARDEEQRARIDHDLRAKQLHDKLERAEQQLAAHREREQLHQHQLSQHSTEMQALVDERAAEKERILTLQSDHDRMVAETTEWSARYDGLVAAVAKRKGEWETKQKTLDEHVSLTTQVAALQSQLAAHQKTSQKRIAELDHALKTSKASNESLMSEMQSQADTHAGLVSEVDRYKQRVFDLETHLKDRDADLTSLHGKSSDSRSEMLAMQQALQAAQRKEEYAQQTLKRLKEEHDELLAAQSEHERILKRSQDELARATQEHAETFETVKQDQQQMMRKWNKDRQGLEDSNKAMREKLLQAEKEVETVTSRLSALTTQLADESIRGKEAQSVRTELETERRKDRERFVEKLRAAEEALAVQVLRASEMEQRTSELEQSLDESEEQHQRLNQAHAALQQQLETINKQYKATMRKLEQLQQQHGEQLQAYESQTSQLRTQSSERGAQIADLQRQLDAASSVPTSAPPSATSLSSPNDFDSHSTDLRQQLADAQAEVTSLNSQLSTASDREHSLVAQLQELQTLAENRPQPQNPPNGSDTGATDEAKANELDGLREKLELQLSVMTGREQSAVADADSQRNRAVQLEVTVVDLQELLKSTQAEMEILQARLQEAIKNDKRGTELTVNSGEAEAVTRAIAEVAEPLRETIVEQKQQLEALGTALLEEQQITQQLQAKNIEQQTQLEEMRLSQEELRSTVSVSEQGIQHLKEEIESLSQQLVHQQENYEGRLRDLQQDNDRIAMSSLKKAQDTGDQMDHLLNQNQQLMEMVRKSSEVKDTTDRKVVSLERDLAQLNEELKASTDSRDRQIAALEEELDARKKADGAKKVKFEKAVAMARQFQTRADQLEAVLKERGWTDDSTPATTEGGNPP